MGKKKQDKKKRDIPELVKRRKFNGKTLISSFAHLKVFLCVSFFFFFIEQVARMNDGHDYL